jgi:cytochrome oxidase Cu insertion factor (SCO1/SenC/PrrC family)
MRTVLFVVLTSVLFVAGCGTETPGAPESGAAEAAPDFTVETFDDGTFSLAEHEGKIVVLNFFESW